MAFNLCVLCRLSDDYNLGRVSSEPIPAFNRQTDGQTDTPPMAVMLEHNSAWKNGLQSGLWKHLTSNYFDRLLICAIIAAKGNDFKFYYMT